MSVLLSSKTSAVSAKLSELVELTGSYLSAYRLIAKPEVAMYVPRYFFTRIAPLLGGKRAWAYLGYRQFAFQAAWKPFTLAGKQIARFIHLDEKTFWTYWQKEEQAWLRWFVRRERSGHWVYSSDQRPHQAPHRYSVAFDLPLIPADQVHLRNLLNGHAPQPDAAGVLEAVQQLLTLPREALLAPDLRSHAWESSEPLSLTDIALNLFPNLQWTAAQKRTLADLTDKLYARYIPGGTREKVSIPLYFIENWLPVLGHEAALVALYLTDRGYFNEATGERRDEVWIEGGLKTLAHLVGQTRLTCIPPVPGAGGRTKKSAPSTVPSEDYRRKSEACEKTREAFSQFALPLAARNGGRDVLFKVALRIPLTPEDKLRWENIVLQGAPLNTGVVVNTKSSESVEVVSDCSHNEKLVVSNSQKVVSISGHTQRQVASNSNEVASNSNEVVSTSRVLTLLIPETQIESDYLVKKNPPPQTQKIGNWPSQAPPEEDETPALNVTVDFLNQVWNIPLLIKSGPLRKKQDELQTLLTQENVAIYVAHALTCLTESLKWPFNDAVNRLRDDPEGIRCEACLPLARLGPYGVALVFKGLLEPGWAETKLAFAELLKPVRAAIATYRRMFGEKADSWQARKDNYAPLLSRLQDGYTRLGLERAWVGLSVYLRVEHTRYEAHLAQFLDSLESRVQAIYLEGAPQPIEVELQALEAILQEGQGAALEALFEIELSDSLVERIRVIREKLEQSLLGDRSPKLADEHPDSWRIIPIQLTARDAWDKALEEVRAPISGGEADEASRLLEQAQATLCAFKQFSDYGEFKVVIPSPDTELRPQGSENYRLWLSEVVAGELAQALTRVIGRPQRVVFGIGTEQHPDASLDTIISETQATINVQHLWQQVRTTLLRAGGHWGFLESAALDWRDGEYLLYMTEAESDQQLTETELDSSVFGQIKHHLQNFTGQRQVVVRVTTALPNASLAKRRIKFALTAEEAWSLAIRRVPIKHFTSAMEKFAGYSKRRTNLQVVELPEIESAPAHLLGFVNQADDMGEFHVRVQPADLPQWQQAQPGLVAVLSELTCQAQAVIFHPSDISVTEVSTMIWEVEQEIQPAQLWQAALDQLRLEMVKNTFDEWLEPTQLDVRDNAFVVVAKTANARDYLENRLTEPILRTLRSLLAWPGTLALGFAVGGR